MALSRAAIVSAGLAILDEYGLGDLSMRRVADALGVQAGALYYHVPNKQSLLAAIADEILAPAEAADDGDAAVGEFLVGWANGLRSALLSHRDAAELVASAHALGLGAVDPCAAGVRRLERQGLANPSASMAALLHFVLGHVMEEQTRSQLQAFGIVTGFDADAARADFDWGVALLTTAVAAG